MKTKIPPRFIVVSALCISAFFAAGLNYTDQNKTDKDLEDFYIALYSPTHADHLKANRRVRSSSKKLDQWSLAYRLPRTSMVQGGDPDPKPKYRAIALFHGQNSFNVSNAELCQQTLKSLRESKTLSATLMCISGLHTTRRH